MVSTVGLYFCVLHKLKKTSRMHYGDSICYLRTRTRAGQTSTAVVIKLMRSLCFAHALCKRNSAIKTVQVMNPAFKSNTACEAF